MNRKHKLTLKEYRVKYTIKMVSTKVPSKVQENVSKSVNFGRNKILQKHYSKVLEATKSQTMKKTYDTLSSNSENEEQRGITSMMADAPSIENATSGLCIFKCLQCTFKNTNWWYSEAPL